MNKRSFSYLFPSILVLGDATVIFWACSVAYGLRFHSFIAEIIPITKGIPPYSLYMYSSLFVMGVFLLIGNILGLYSRSRPKLILDQFYVLFKVVTLTLFITGAFTFFYRETTYSRLTLVLIWFTSLSLIYLERVILTKLETFLMKRGIGAKRTIIVGSQEMGGNLYERLSGQPQMGYQIIKFICVNGEEKTGNGWQNIDHLPQIIEKERIDLVLVALPLAYHQKISEIILDCDHLNVEFQIAPDLLELMAVKAQIVAVDRTPFISLGKTPLEGWNRFVKRIFDLICSTLGLIILSPIFLILSLIVKLDSPGPAFYRQERLGRDGKKFLMIKFRSMYTDSEKDGPKNTSRQDPRRTKVGIILRKLSLDELPQLINVFKGEMSLVGPRPERPIFVDKFREDIPRYFVRHKVKSGITGWAQVNGLRGDTSLEERTKYDLFYVENWSLGFDIKIILMTLRTLFRQKNAY
jgi:Undecaprenyl-phosphate glucose phosphotransferase